MTGAKHRLFVAVLCATACQAETGSRSDGSPGYPDSKLPEDCSQYEPEAFIEDYVYAFCRVLVHCDSNTTTMEQCVDSESDYFECEVNSASISNCERMACIEDLRHWRDNLEVMGCVPEGSLFFGDVGNCVSEISVYDDCLSVIDQ